MDCCRPCYLDPCVCVLSRAQFFVTPWTVAHQVPMSMEFSSKNTGGDCRSLLHGIFPTQGSNLHLLLQQADSLTTVTAEKPLIDP